MKAILQKVVRSSVTVQGEVVGAIGKGYNVLLGIGADDTKEDADWIVQKLLHIRLWNSASEDSTLSATPGLRWSDNIQQSNGSLLIISQFTLFAQLKGNKVDFHRAMKGQGARALYERVIEGTQAVIGAQRVQQGEFGAMMQVEIVNDGPVTITIESKRQQQQQQQATQG